MSAPELREERETAKAPAPAPRRSLVRRGVRDVFQGYALWLLYRWLVHGMDEVSPGMRELLALFVVVALWVCVAGFLRGRADRQARRTAVVAAALAVGAFVTVVAARPAPIALAELPTPAASALMLALAGGLGLWVRYAEPCGRS
ncbi:hypothetical protein [Streptomyces sp. KN37]|uniref:hypothetical protein n=1 Tax=Streptomyces sp. KN37 TaxID=3090667 RepID=UPI002A76125D|nr:hypothetical protein [Streptomyces sp. KN37]WPO71483.1 hypothetical protein R9806_12985 [Streptomyces sp. KN37]